MLVTTLETRHRPEDQETGGHTSVGDFVHQVLVKHRKPLPTVLKGPKRLGGRLSLWVPVSMGEVHWVRGVRGVTKVPSAEIRGNGSGDRGDQRRRKEQREK